MKRFKNPQATSNRSTVKISTPSISQDEWDFDKVPDAELDACYYYEFARSSDVIRRGVHEWREKFPNLSKVKYSWLTAPTSTLKPGTEIHSDPKEFEKYGRCFLDNQAADEAKPKHLNKVDERILSLVASFNEFPEVSWQSVADVKLKALHAKNFKFPEQQEIKRNPELCLTDITFQISVWEKMRLSPYEMLKKAEKHQSNLSSKLTSHLLTLSWNYSNDDLVTAFGAWLAKHRPVIYPEQKQPQKMTGMDWQKLPLGKRTALDYLGVYRRKKTCAWSGFLKRWPEKADEESRISQLKGECAKAKMIIAMIGG